MGKGGGEEASRRYGLRFWREIAEIGHSMPWSTSEETGTTTCLSMTALSCCRTGRLATSFTFFGPHPDDLSVGTHHNPQKAPARSRTWTGSKPLGGVPEHSMPSRDQNQADGGWTERKWWEYISLGWPSVGGTLNPSFQGEPRGGCLIPLLGGVVVMSFAQESHSWVSSDTSQLPTEARQFLRSRSLEIALYSRNPTSRCPDKPSSYLPIPLWSIPYPPNTEWQVRRVREATLGALPYAVAQ